MLYNPFILLNEGITDQLLFLLEHHQELGDDLQVRPHVHRLYGLRLRKVVLPSRRQSVRGALERCRQRLTPLVFSRSYTYGVNEIQHVNCSGSKGAFYLSFRNQGTEEIKYNDKLSTVTSILEASKAVGHVSITFSNTSEKAQVCDKDNVMKVEFLTELGDLPNLCVAALVLSLPSLGSHRGPRPHFQSAKDQEKTRVNHQHYGRRGAEGQ